MGRQGDGERKSDTTIHMKLAVSFENEAKRVWQESYLRDLTWKDFCAAMMRLGLEAFVAEERSAEKAQ